MSNRTAALALALLLAQSGCATPQSRCSEYEQAVSYLHTEISATDRVKASGTLSTRPVVDVSEEAALLSKRLKTLCELVWAERIPYGAYQADVRRAYFDYHQTRIDRRSGVRRLP